MTLCQETRWPFSGSTGPRTWTTKLHLCLFTSELITWEHVCWLKLHSNVQQLRTEPTISKCMSNDPTTTTPSSHTCSTRIGIDFNPSHTVVFDALQHAHDCLDTVQQFGRLCNLLRFIVVHHHANQCPAYIRTNTPKHVTHTFNDHLTHSIKTIFTGIRVCCFMHNSRTVMKID